MPSAARPVSAYVHGIFPRSARLVAATRDYERRRATPAEVAERRAEHTAAFVNRQRRAGLALFSDGLLAWQDLFRTLVEASDGLHVGGLVRWFDTNSFFRAPIVSSEPALRDLSALSFAPGVPEPRVATLPSPLLFSRVCHLSDDTEAGRDALMRRLAARVLAPAAHHAVASGAAVVHLEEPWAVVRRVASASWDAFGAALEEVRAGLGAPVVLHTSFGDAGPVIDRLLRLPVDALGVDVVETDVAALRDGWPMGLVVGCVDGRSSLVESVDATVKVARAAADRVRPPALYLSSGTSFDLLPEQIAAAKLDVLGEAARTIAGEGE